MSKDLKKSYHSYNSYRDNSDTDAGGIVFQYTLYDYSQ